jgi:hypothetical protein
MYGVDYICVQFVYYPFRTWSRRGRDRMVVGFTTKTTDVLNSNLDQGDVYNIMW